MEGSGQGVWAWALPVKWQWAWCENHEIGRHAGDQTNDTFDFGSMLIQYGLVWERSLTL